MSVLVKEILFFAQWKTSKIYSRLLKINFKIHLWSTCFVIIFFYFVTVKKMGKDEVICPVVFTETIQRKSNFWELEAKQKLSQMNVERYIHTGHVMCVKKTLESTFNIWRSRWSSRKGLFVFFFFYCLLTHACHQHLEEAWCKMSKGCESCESCSRLYFDV